MYPLATASFVREHLNEDTARSVKLRRVSLGYDYAQVGSWFAGTFDEDGIKPVVYNYKQLGRMVCEESALILGEDPYDGEW